MAPIQFLDGEWAAGAFLALILPTIAARSRRAFLQVLSSATAVLFIVNILSSFALMMGLL